MYTHSPGQRFIDLEFLFKDSHKVFLTFVARYDSLDLEINFRIEAASKAFCDFEIRVWSERHLSQH